MNAIQKTFNALSEKYDSQRTMLIPCFQDFYDTTLILSEQVDNVHQILDVGAGTGLLSVLFAKKYPETNITLLDYSVDMLAKARDRFQGNTLINYNQADFSTVNLDLNKYDLVVSSLAIHHLTHELKQKLFQKIYRSLRPGGLFINAELIKGASEFEEKINFGQWAKSIRESALPEEEKAATFKRIELDITAPVKDQVQWLRNAGFKEAATYYQYFNFVVFAAKK